MLPPTRLFIHYLGRLHALLQQVALFDGDLAATRLHPAMAPLVQQARTAIGFTLGASCPPPGT
jgi:hypothetical protein